MVELLEKRGGKTNASDVLFKSAVEEQERLKREVSGGSSVGAKAKEATGIMAKGMAALRERGERLERLDAKTAQLQGDAANYAQMAKQMKDKNKKKAKFFGL